MNFRLLEGGSGWIFPAGEASSLEQWYLRVRDVPIAEFDDGDLSRACRQLLHLDHVVPVCVSRLDSNPCAGGLYDGELMAALKTIPSAYWKRNPGLARQIVELVDRVAKACHDEELLADAKVLARNVSIEK